MMNIQPCIERSELLLYSLDSFGILYGCIYFETITNDTWICHQSRPVFFCVSRDLINLKAIVSTAKVFDFLENGNP